MSWITNTLFGNQERAKSTLAYGSMAISLIAVVLTLVLVFLLRV
jgi:hypothetical protein